MSPWLRLVPLVALWAVPVVAVAVAVPAVGMREEASIAPPLPSVVTVGSQSTDDRTSVTVSIEIEQAGPIRSPVSGLLTSLAEIDGPVRPGQELFAVDGVPILAQPGTAPLHRDLREGDAGEDVEVLARFLVDAGLLDGDLAGSTFDRGTRAAVVQLQEELGVRVDGVFRPGYVAYLPRSAAELGEPQLTVGSMVAAGETILETAPVPMRIRFIPTSMSTSLTELQDAPLTLTFGDLQIAVSGLEPTAAELATIHAGLREAVAGGEAQVTESEVPGEPEQYDGGLLSRAEPQVRAVVPGTSVHVNGSGTQCLFQRQEDGGWAPERIRALEPAVGTLGAFYVDPSLIDARIARDPLTLPGEVLAECR
ncbi:peptidoglycan-binding domain-containing protein [Pseudactinotalea sp. HY160]|uniref:peptidoglycan-binding domain-containing protein n=1 Tax=Pseudactinotalea sp. HY160 TaxID=2654490 RepID=UPI0018841FBB